MFAWAFATIWLFASFEWISISLSRYGNLPQVLAWLAVLLLAMALATYHAVAMALVHAITHRWNQLHKWSQIAKVVAMGCAWTLAELARSAWLTGFPWASPGYAHIDGGLSALAPFIGVMGLTWVSSIVAAGLAMVQQSSQTGTFNKASVHGLVILILIWSIELPQLGNAQMAQTVTLLQANVDPLDKFKNEGREEADWYLNQIQSSTTELTLAPETALATIGTFDGFKSTPELAQIDPGKALIIGAMEGLSDGYANAAWSKMQGQWLRYHKTHLVPFGEFTPSLFNWFVKWANIPYSDFKSGQDSTNPLIHNQHVYAIGICYEDLFGDEMAGIVMNAPRVPTALINISNLAWFGDGRALDQHLVIGRMRALELRRPMLMSTNTGWSAVINDSGQVVARMPKSQRGALSVSYQGVQAAPSPYAQWAGRWGHLPLWLICLIGLIVPMGIGMIHSVNHASGKGRLR